MVEKMGMEGTPSRSAEAKMELLLALYDHLSAEIGELHDKIDRLTEAIQEMKHGEI